MQIQLFLAIQILYEPKSSLCQMWVFFWTYQINDLQELQNDKFHWICSRPRFLNDEGAPSSVWINQLWRHRRLKTSNAL